MTIRVEREALLRVISRAPLSKGPLIDEEEFVIVELPETKQFIYDGLIPSAATDEDDDDQASLCSLSTDSSVTTASTVDDDERPRVTFATDLVTDVWTRERTPLEDVSLLYYSGDETTKFRQEYRLERKVLSELSIDPETFPGDEEELASIVATATGAPAPKPNGASPSSNRHRISRVVILHNDKLETFFNNPAQESKEDDGDFLSSLISPTNSAECQEYQRDPLSPSNNNSSDFFDNDSFWSGSLTWY